MLLATYVKDLEGLLQPRNYQQERETERGKFPHTPLKEKGLEKEASLLRARVRVVFTKPAVGLQNAAAGSQNEAAGSQNEAVGLQNEAVGSQNEAVQFGNEAVNFAGCAVRSGKWEWGEWGVETFKRFDH